MRLLCLLAILCLPAQVVHSADTEYTISPDSVFRHIVILASDSLEGREVGEPGEWKAAQYITSVFRRLGVEPKGSEGSYLQEFNFIKRIDMGPKNRLEMNGQPLEPEEDFKPLFHSVNAAFEFNEIIDVGYGIINDDSSHNDYEGTDVEGKAVLVRRFTPESEAGLDTTLEQYSSIASKISTALEHKAGGVFFITPEKHDDSVRSTGVMRVKAKDIPIVLLHRRALEKLGLDVSRPSISSLVGETNLVHVRDTGYNVIGYLPGQTESTIVIGAHYDHLGWGGPASRYHGKEKKIHRGADDNGSGVAALLELARRFAPRMDNMRHSLLFIAFSGEEAGLLGSSHFVRNWTVDRDKATMMINMDMIGRLKQQEKGLAIMGVGTSQEFGEYFEGLDAGELKITLVQSGVGSDHTAFYNDSIPSLHFFTGAHEDYHTPSDVLDKIDPDGIVSVSNLIAEVITHFDRHDGQLVFQRTKDSKKGHRASFSVTLGVTPDFVTEVEGLGVDGVSAEGPADNAGILKGDVIIKMDNLVVGDIYDYMNGLSKYRKGDSSLVTLVRETDTLKVVVNFE